LPSKRSARSSADAPHQLVPEKIQERSRKLKKIQEAATIKVETCGSEPRNQQVDSLHHVQLSIADSVLQIRRQTVPCPSECVLSLLPLPRPFPRLPADTFIGVNASIDTSIGAIASTARTPELRGPLAQASAGLCRTSQ